MLAIAHRSGNTVAGLRQALDAGVDLVEADVHAYRGRLEVRHHKNLGPAHLWDKWELVTRAGFGRVELGELLRELGDDPRLMVDLKGIDRRLAPAVAAAFRAHAPGAPFTVCTKHWWMLDAFDPVVGGVLSASNRPALARLRHRLAVAPAFGVSVHLRLLTPALVAELGAGTDVVMTWPVDTPADLARARTLNVDAVISKDLDLLAGVVADR
jgi:glycerophosphoryl diester phosphodiesterase